MKIGQRADDNGPFMVSGARFKMTLVDGSVSG